MVTRAPEDAAPLVLTLRSHGLSARPLPCLVRAPLPWPEALCPAEHGRTVVVCTSAFAAQCVVKQARHDGWGQNVALAALSPTTSTTLSQLGHVPQIVCRGGSEALAAAIADDAVSAPLARILYPTSDVGLQTEEQARALARLLPGCADVRRAAVYTTRPPPDLHDAVAALPSPIGLVFFSPSAVDAFLDVAVDPLVQEARVLCVGASTQRAWDRRATTPTKLVHDSEDIVSTLVTWTATIDPDEVRS